MCGRFTLKTPASVLAETFELAEPPAWTPRYNIAPTQPVAAVVRTPEHPTRQFRRYRWGLVPSWAKDLGIGARTINAQAETAATKPAFRVAFRHRRCLVLADGFYEWDQRARRKRPVYIQMKDGRAFAFAGLWEHWQSPDGSVINSCTLLTTEPNGLIRPFHHRMPVILDPRDYDRWLDPHTQKPEEVQPLLRPLPPEAMRAYPVSDRVNNPSNDSPECIEPLASGQTPGDAGGTQPP